MRLECAPRRRIGLTALIDVIFLLLLFFMLSSTFSRFQSLDLPISSASGAGISVQRSVFVTAAQDGYRYNGTPVNAAELDAELAVLEQDQSVLLSPAQGLNAQGLVDVLHLLQQHPHLQIALLNPN